MRERLNISIVKRNGFTLREDQGVPYYSCCAFEKLPGLCHGFSTRQGQVPPLSKGSFNLSYSSWDSPERVRENRRQFLSALHLQDARLATLRQVHSNRVYIIKDISGQWNQPEGDALATQLPGVALAVQTADCMPILVADPERNAVAAVHAGWRGMLSRILAKTVQEMQNVFNSDPQTILVAVGPGIRSCCFEVGPEVVDLFKREYRECRLAEPICSRTGKYLLDLTKALNVQLDHAGVRRENRYDLGACTCCNIREFFSYRSEGHRSGRMMAVVGKIMSG